MSAEVHEVTLKKKQRNNGKKRSNNDRQEGLLDDHTHTMQPLYRIKARIPMTAAAAEAIPPDRRGAAPVNIIPWEGEAEAEAIWLCMGSAPLGMGVDMELEAGVAAGTWTGIME